MKKLVKFFMAVAIVFGAAAVSSCDPEDPTPNPDPTPEAPAEPTINPDEYENSPVYSVKYDGATVNAGDIVTRPISDAEMDDAFVVVDFTIKNESMEAQSTVAYMDMIYGPESFREIGICISTCQNGTAPFACNPYEIAAGAEQSLELEAFPGDKGVYHSAIYKVTVGQGQELNNPQVFFLKLTF